MCQKPPQGAAGESYVWEHRYAKTRNCVHVHCATCCLLPRGRRGNRQACTVVVCCVFDMCVPPQTEETGGQWRQVCASRHQCATHRVVSEVPHARFPSYPCQTSLFASRYHLRACVVCVWVTLELPGSLPVWTSFRGKECCHFAYCVARRARVRALPPPHPPPTPHLSLVHECRSIKERMIDEDLRNRKLAYLAAHNSWKREVCSPIWPVSFGAP